MKEKISRLNGEPQLIPGELSVDDRGEQRKQPIKDTKQNL